MESGTQSDKAKSNRKKLWIALSLVVLVLLALVLPPFISLEHYKGRINDLVSTSLGRPVKTSAVEMRLLPRPGFVLYDLTVDEDPAFGAEPVLHASSVVASLNLFSLWRGKFEISRISVDEASFNIVRTDQGRWNTDALFRSAAHGVGGGIGSAAATGSSKTHTFPTLVATNSRINFKRGAEKLPYSLTNTELTLSANSNSKWQLELRAVPLRTDLATESTDTGEIRMDAEVTAAPELRQMPLKIQLEWRKAQLGQLTRLLLGADAGWRGDMTGNLNLTGTAENAHIQSRLRATNVHRAEYTPSTVLDFDANCAFDYHATARSIEKIECDSPIGPGQIRLTGNLRNQLEANGNHTIAPGTALNLEVKNFPAEAGIGVLRALREGLLPEVTAKGTLNGHLSYVEPEAGPQAPQPKKKAAKSLVANQLSGSLQIADLELSGGALKDSLNIPNFEIAPAATQPGTPHALEAKFSLPAGEATPLTVEAHFERRSYRCHIHGNASVERSIVLAESLGSLNAADAPNLTSGTVTTEIETHGPWIAGSAPAPDTTSAALTLHNARLDVSPLLNPVEIASGTIHADNSGTSWDNVNFVFGTLKGIGSYSLKHCEAPCATPIVPTFALKLERTEAPAIVAAFLGAHEKGTLISNLLARLRPEKPLNWQRIDGTVQADAITLGPLTLTAPKLELELNGATAKIKNFEGNTLGGALHGSGSFEFADNKPHYVLKGEFSAIKPAELGRVLSQNWSGAAINGKGELDLSGFSGDELAASSKGLLNFDWQHGTAPQTGAASDQSAALARFDGWTGEAQIAAGKITLGKNQLTHDKESLEIKAEIPLALPAKFSLTQSFPAPSSAPSKPTAKTSGK